MRRLMRAALAASLAVVLPMCGDDKTTIIQGGSGELGTSEGRVEIDDGAVTRIYTGVVFTRGNLDGTYSGTTEVTEDCAGITTPPTLPYSIRINGTGSGNGLQNGVTGTGTWTGQYLGLLPATGRLTLTGRSATTIFLSDRLDLVVGGTPCTLTAQGTLAR